MHLVAHRGKDNHNYSENSLKAINNSLSQDYIDGVEIDVRITKDNEIVLIHDPVIDFISDGHGIVKYMTLEELRMYKYGKSEEKIYTLKEILDSIDTNKIILVELKELGNDFIELVDETIKIISNYHLNIYISSFNYNLLNYIKSNYPNIRCGIIIGYGLNIIYLNNDFDFNIISYKYISKINTKKISFVFNGDDKNLSNDIYLISDICYRYN